MADKISIRINVNGKDYELLIKQDTRLIDVLREELNLTGTKEGCGIGRCGTCTVLVDDKAVRSCVVPARSAHGKKIETVEGLEQKGELHQLQKSFLEKSAVQCGFCTPGMLMSAKSLLQRNPRPTRGEVTKAISTNLCRCTGYEQIIEAILEAAKKMK